jgi:HlyD family secretion protein
MDGLRSTGRSAARAGLAQADAVLRAAEQALQRTQVLVAQGFLSTAALDEARRAVDVAKAQQTSAAAQTQANADAGTDMAQAQAQLALAKAATVAAKARLAQAALLAPADARVLTRNVEPGQIVQPGKALMSLALNGATQLEAQVDERFLDQLQVGQPATVVADAFADQPFAARVLSIAPAVDAQRGAIEVKFSLTQQAPVFLREDMTLSVQVETARRESALALPLGALRATPRLTAGASGATGVTGVSVSTASVLVVEDGRATSRAVRLGLRTLSAAEVLDGLAEGDQVVLDDIVEPGARVRTRAVPWQTAVQTALPGAKPDAGAALTNAMGR